MTTIYLDADSCPVREEVEKVITRHSLNLIVVSNGGIRPSKNLLIKNIIVPKQPDAADIWILSHITCDDVVITADLPLAKECLKQNAHVLKHNGDIYTRDNIDNLIATRNLMADMRSENPMFQNKNKPFSTKDRSRFLDSLEREIQRAMLK